MPSCNNNSNITRIYVDNGCNPCNPCSSCNKCSCDCTCQQPDYNTAGCITIQPTDCIRYNGPAILASGISTNDTLTDVIQALAGSSILMQSSAPIEEEPVLLQSSAKTTSVEDLERYTMYQYENASNQIEDIKSRIKKEGFVSSLKVETDGIVEAEMKSKKLKLDFNFESFLEGLVDFVHENPVAASKVAQIINFIQGNKEDFTLYPYEVSLDATEDTIKVKWSPVENISHYTVYYKSITDGDFIKAGQTPALGLTIPNLESGVEYQIYVVSTGTNGTNSLSSPIESIQTK